MGILSKFNFNSISPSAKYLLLIKGLTPIPFAKEAVELIWSENSSQFSQEELSSIEFILKCIHFETRYNSDNNTFSGNRIWNNDWYGYRIISSNFNIFSENTVLNHLYTAFRLDTGCYYNEFSENNASYNSRGFPLQ